MDKNRLRFISVWIYNLWIEISVYNLLNWDWLAHFDKLSARRSSDPFGGPCENLITLRWLFFHFFNSPNKFSIFIQPWEVILKMGLTRFARRTQLGGPAKALLLCNNTFSFWNTYANKFSTYFKKKKPSQIEKAFAVWTGLPDHMYSLDNKSFENL